MATTVMSALAVLTRTEATHTHIPATEHLASVIARLRNGMLTLEGLEQLDTETAWTMKGKTI